MSSIVWEPHVTVLQYSEEQTALAQSYTAVTGRPLGEMLVRLFPEPDDGISESSGNSLTEGGARNIALLLTGDPQALPLVATSHEQACALIGVGSDHAGNPRAPLALGTLGPVAGEGPHLTWYQEMDPGFPFVQDDGSIAGQVTVGPDHANFPWHEWGWVACPPQPPGKAFGPHLHQAASGAVLMNRKAAFHGVKQQGRAWVLKVSIRVVVLGV